MCGWLVECGLALRPLVGAMKGELFAGGLVHHDDTPVDMQDYNAGKPRGQRMREARLWVATAPPREGPWTVFDFTASRAADGPRGFLADVRCSVVCDAYTVYGKLATLEYGPPAIVLTGCWAHVRRYFREAHLSDHPAEGAAFLHLIGLLRADDARRLEMRRERSLPVLAQIREKMEALLPSTQPSSKLGKALSYTDKIWLRLTAYAEDGRLPIDNNPAERAIRPVAVGRNNWLFFGSERGGQAAANWMSVIGTCKRAGVEPFSYLSDVLRRLPSAKTGPGVRELLPDVWKPL
jgi:hypothetical protein